MRRTLIFALAIFFSAGSGCAGCDDEVSDPSGTGGDALTDGEITGGDDGGESDGTDDGGVIDGGDDGGTVDGGDDGGTVDGGDDAGGTSDGGMDDAGSTGMDAVDATDADGGGDGMSCMGGLSYCNGSCVDTSTSDQHCGSCGNQCGTEAECTSGTCECPTYQQNCNGTCVSTNVDPDNCGSCGNQCTGNTVCNGGQCVNADDVGCPAQTTQCGNECVDTDTDPDNCGSCGNSCPSGEGCANGTCADLVQVGSPPAKCKGPDPEINIGFKSGNTKKKCKGQVAKTTFRWGLCSCNDIDLQNNYLFDAFDSRSGPYEPGGFGGGVGTNGQFTAEKGEIYGALWVAGQAGIQLDNTLHLYQQLHSGGPMNFGSPASYFEDDAYVDGNLNKNTGSPIQFNQTLYVPSNHTIGSQISYNNLVRQSVSVGTVCKRCKDSYKIPIETIVKNHVNNNDNSKIGLNADALNQPGSPTVLELPCGKYFLNKVDVDQRTVIRATGITALFIDGDVLADGQLTIRAARGAELDVFVNGQFNATSNDTRIGAPAFPAANRFYVNGGWTSFNDTSMGAYIYSIPGGMTLKNNLEVFGGVYTQNLQRNLNTNNNLEIHYDREVLDADKTCDDPNNGGGSGGDGGYSDADGGGTTTGGDGGTTGDGGTSTGDDGGGSTTGTDADGSYDADGGGSTCTVECGSCSADSECCDALLCSGGSCGECCSGEGDACFDDGDCCSPLVCNNGTCQTSSCKNLYESCSSDGECCSGNCAGGVCDSG